MSLDENVWLSYPSMKHLCAAYGAKCNIDYQLLRIKIKVTGKGGSHHLRTKRCKRFDVSRLTGRDETCRQLYRELICRKTTEAWVNEGTVEEKWSATQ